MPKLSQPPSGSPLTKAAGLKGKVIRAEDAHRCCQEAVRIGIQSLRAWYFSALSEVWNPPSRDSVYVMGYAKLPEPGIEIDFQQGWRSATSVPSPRTGSGGVVSVVAIGSIIIDLISRQEAAESVQTVVEVCTSALEVAKDVATRRGQNHCLDCILGNCLSQNAPRKWITERIRRRL